MLKLATARDPRFDVDERELKREGETYSYDTLAQIRAERGPDAVLVFLVGSDAFARIDTWHRWSELFDLAHFAVAIRGDDEEWASKGPGAFPREVWPRITLNLRELLSAPSGKVMTFRMTPHTVEIQLEIQPKTVAVAVLMAFHAPMTMARNCSLLFHA